MAGQTLLRSHRGREIGFRAVAGCAVNPKVLMPLVKLVCRSAPNNCRIKRCIRKRLRFFRAGPGDHNAKGNQPHYSCYPSQYDASIFGSQGSSEMPGAGAFAPGLSALPVGEPSGVPSGDPAHGEAIADGSAAERVEE